MAKISTTYPEYNFAKNVGYGTAEHQQALQEHGICPEHRKSFRPIQKIIRQSSQSDSIDNIPAPDYAANTSSNVDQPDSVKNTPSTTSNSTGKGQTAELIIAEHLEALDHTIIAHNFRTKTYEIDLISIQDQTIFFTEVKYRKSNHSGTTLEQITPQKHQQMQYAAQLFLAQHPEFAALQPQLAAGTVSGDSFNFEEWFAIQ